MSEDLQTELLAAHRDGRPAFLSGLYARAARIREDAGDTEAACFYLTHAYVFALEAGLDTRAIHAQLERRGREE